MIGGLDFYVHEAELDDTELLQAHLKHISRLIKDGTIVDEITSEIRREARATEDSLAAEIDAIFADR